MYVHRKSSISVSSSNSALQVENLLDHFRSPAERQVAVECLGVVARLDEDNPQISLTGEIIDIPSLIREAAAQFWLDWVEQQSVPTLSTPGKISPIGLSVVHSISSREGTPANSPALAAPDAKPAAPIKGGPSDLSFKTNERLARRMFFDLRQDGERGTMSYLASSCIKLVFGVVWKDNVNLQ